jgi:hypothetical protein
MTNEIAADAEDYCSDCGCVADDEICPRCRAMIADAQRREGMCHGDRRWNGQAMSRRRTDVDDTILIDIREKP